MRKLIFFFALLTAAGCAGRPGKNLAGTTWSSDFDLFHNKYVFETDTTGYSLDGVRTAQGMRYGEEQPFRYALTPSELTIEHLAILDKRVFMREGSKKNPRFVSIYAYASGREVLLREK